MRIIKIPIKNQNDENKNKAKSDDELYDFICQCAKMKYEHETRREDSIIQQASHMQAAFSFIIVAIIMAIPVYKVFCLTSQNNEYTVKYDNIADRFLMICSV